MNFNKAFVDQANQELASANIDQILKWTFKTFDNQVRMTTTCSYNSVVLLNHIRQFQPDIPLYFFDTGYHFKETLDFCYHLQNKWGLNLTIIKPEISKSELKKQIGDPPYKVDPDNCCYHCKVKPLLKILSKSQAWLSAIRRDQTPKRKNIRAVELDPRGTLKIHPLYNWPRERVWNYVHDHKLPYNPLYDRNYPSIGCEPCTAPVINPKHEREGRWVNFNKTECGLNVYSEDN